VAISALSLQVIDKLKLIGLMGEAIKVQSRQSPLAELHQRLGAMMLEREGWSLPASYGDKFSEYAAVRNGGTGLIDLSSRGRLLVSGSEGLQFLNGLITNDMKTLAQNQWMHAAFPNVQGRLLAMVRVIHQHSSDKPAANGYLIDTEAASFEQVFKTLQRFTFAGDFHVDDLTERTVCLSLQGAGAAAVASSVLSAELASLERFQVLTTVWRDQLVTVLRATHTGEDGFDFFIEAATAPALWEELTWHGRPAREAREGGLFHDQHAYSARDGIEEDPLREPHGWDARATPIGYDALEILRLEAGIPRFGIDMDETNVVTETGLDDAVSFNKGCYIGQEIIARIKYRGHVAKRLSGLVFHGPSKKDFEQAAKIRTIDGKEIGRLTSTGWSIQLDRQIALGYVKYDYLAPGTEVRVASGADEAPAHVVELPFVRGSWWS